MVQYSWSPHMNLHVQAFAQFVAWETAKKTALFQMSQVHLTCTCLQTVDKKIWQTEQQYLDKNYFHEYWSHDFVQKTIYHQKWKHPGLFLHCSLYHIEE
jgi:DNA-binding GntR family transcriptional regulator